MEKLKLKLMRENAILPKLATEGSVGYDISASISEKIIINPGETKLIHSGFALELKRGYAAFIYARSGLGVKHGIVPANCVGVIDSDYRGEVMVGLQNHSEVAFTINPFDRIAQMVIVKCETPEIIICQELDETKRSDGGFGSTGRF
ncbi:MAG: dUTP diphosphatase [Oscillospiraceae bacterium]|nr:dUTP diphosphatase [Oscillospiraceae bacterium]